jgi:hypothetical protein
MIRHEAYDSKADVYSWGVMLVEVLTQRAPYDGLYLTPVQVRRRQVALLWLKRSSLWFN